MPWLGQLESLHNELGWF